MKQFWQDLETDSFKTYAIPNVEVLPPIIELHTALFPKILLFIQSQIFIIDRQYPACLVTFFRISLLRKKQLNGFFSSLID